MFTCQGLDALGANLTCTGSFGMKTGTSEVDPVPFDLVAAAK